MSISSCHLNYPNAICLCVRVCTRETEVFLKYNIAVCQRTQGSYGIDIGLGFKVGSNGHDVRKVVKIGNR